MYKYCVYNVHGVRKIFPNSKVMKTLHLPNIMKNKPQQGYCLRIKMHCTHASISSKAKYYAQ